MQDENKTKKQLINELIELRQQITELQTLIPGRKQAEETLRIKDWAIESSVNGIVISNLEGYLTYVNRSFLKMWGYDEKEVLGKHILEFCQNEDEDTQVMEELQDEGWIGEMKAKRKDGSLFDVSFSASVVKNKDDHRGRGVDIQDSMQRGYTIAE
jgi:PAS domain S-box-containing protein